CDAPPPPPDDGTGSGTGTGADTGSGSGSGSGSGPGSEYCASAPEQPSYSCDPRETTWVRTKNKDAFVLTGSALRRDRFPVVTTHVQVSKWSTLLGRLGIE